MVVLDAVRCFFLLYTEKSTSRNTKSQGTAGLLLFGLKHHVRHLRASAARPQLGEPCSCRTSPKPPDPTRLSVGGGGGGGEAVRDATLPYCDGREQHHGGHVVQERGENGRDETEDDDHGPHSAPGQLIGLR